MEKEKKAGRQAIDSEPLVPMTFKFTVKQAAFIRAQGNQSALMRALVDQEKNRVKQK